MDKLDKKAVQTEIKNYKIRQGPLYKRSKFLKEWRDRWIVLTMNYIFTFTKKDCLELTDAINLKEVKSYKSYVQKQQEMIPVGFKIRTQDQMFYFCARSCNQKWSWIVTLQRLMDYKYVGASTYNNVQYIKTKGFQSQAQFQNGGKIQKTINFNQKQVKTAAQAKKTVDSEADKIMEELKKQKQEFKKKEEELKKKAQDIQSQRMKFLQETKLSAQRSQQQYHKNQQSSFIIQQPKPQVKKQEPKPIQTKPVEVKPQSPKKQMKHVEQEDDSENSVTKLRKFYENKAKETSKQTVPHYEIKKKPQFEKKQIKYENRSKVIAGIFDQLRVQNSSGAHGFKIYLDFLVRVGADPSLGYSSFVVIQAKSHTNRQNFADAFIEYISEYTDYSNSYNIAKFYEILVFQIPDLLNDSKQKVIKKKFQDFLNHTNDEQSQQIILKSMYISHKIEKYNKSPELVNKLDNLVKISKRQETKNWAKKLKDDL